MPQYRTSDLDRLVAGLLADDVMDTWSDNLNTIIDTLKPEGAGPREPGPRTATLHSEVTRETVVLHAANEDEVEDVLVVNEEQGGEEAGPAPAPPQQSPVMRGQAKPPTYVPIPSRKEKHRPSSSVAPAWVLPQLSPLGDTATSSFLAPSSWAVLLTAGLMGLGDAAFNTQIISFLSANYRQNSSQAFALMKFIQSVGVSAGFAVSTRLGLHWQLLVLSTFLMLATAGFVWVETKTRRELAQPPISSSQELQQLNKVN